MSPAAKNFFRLLWRLIFGLAVLGACLCSGPLFMGPRFWSKGDQ